VNTARKAKYLVFSLFLSIHCSLHATEITLFWAQGADVNLPDIIPKALRGEIKMDPTYFWGINYKKAFPRADNRVSRFLEKYSITADWEAQLTKHHGLQDNFESHLALLLRTRDFSIVGPLQINFALGMGPSYAFSTPTYEDGPNGQPNQGKYKFQNYVAYEMDWSLRSLPDWSLAFRVHHRSGIFGVIAPSKVGSNFFAVGIRRHF
jgi:hypothetical protein